MRILTNFYLRSYVELFIFLKLKAPNQWKKQNKLF